jgi:hypothetical protein
VEHELVGDLGSRGFDGFAEAFADSAVVEAAAERVREH